MASRKDAVKFGERKEKISVKGPSSAYRLCEVVVVVRTMHNDLYMDYSAVRQTTHLAARLKQLAPPGTILLTAATVWLVEGLARIKALGPMSVRGLAESVEVCELLGASGRRRRLQAATARGLTPFVGRQTELAVLSAALPQAGAAHGLGVTGCTPEGTVAQR